MMRIVGSYVRIGISAGPQKGKLAVTHSVICPIWGWRTRWFGVQGDQCVGLKHAAVLLSGSLPSAHWEQHIWQSPVAIE